MVKLKDVAASANVSIATASKVLGGGVESERISDGARQRILDACRELGYRPNYMARSLQSGRAHAIGSLMGHDARIYSNRAYYSSLPFWGLINAGVLDATSQRRYQLVTIGGGGVTPSIERALQSLQERRIDALIMPGYLSWSPLTEKMIALRLPAVMTIGNETCDLPTVDVDDVKGVQLAVEHLCELGHRRLMWIAFEKDETSPEHRREKAFTKITQSLGIETEILRLHHPDEAQTPEENIEAARSALIEMWSQTRTQATGVVAFNETLGFGVYAACQKLGIAIPDDLSVVAFDDLFAHVAYPAMTVVSLMLHDIGVRCVELALEVAAKPDEWSHWLHHRESLEPVLVVRKSTARPKKRAPKDDCA